MTLADRIVAMDLHACGEPGRVILGGVSGVPGGSMLEAMHWLCREGDGLRRLMLREPRGYPAANCNLVLPSRVPGVEAGFVIMEQAEYAPMSGTNTICVATALVESGSIPRSEGRSRFKLEAPAGVIEVEVEVRAGKVRAVTFENVPAFALHLGVAVKLPEIGLVEVDIAWGGMFYVIADADALGLEIAPTNARRLARVGAMLTQAAREQWPVSHPDTPSLTGPTIAQLSASSHTPGLDRRNAVVVSTGDLDWNNPDTWTGALDRSPCGTGTCAKMAALHARGELPLNRPFVHAGVLGTRFTGRLLRPARVGPFNAVVPALTGQAWVTGYAEYTLDPDDPFPEGFTVGDIWPS